MHNDLETILQSLLQRQIRFVLNEKCFKTGRLLLYKISDYYIQLILRVGTANKTIEIPYPFDCICKNNTLQLVYKHASLHKNKAHTKELLQSIKPFKKSKYYDNVLTIVANEYPIQVPETVRSYAFAD